MRYFRGCVLGVAVLFTAAFSDRCLGHAFPDHSDPKVGSELKTPPTQVRIWFDEELAPPKSTMQVFDEAGHEIDKKDCHIDKDDKTLLIVTLPDKLPPGTYKVVWTALCTESHVTHGDFKFIVKAP